MTPWNYISQIGIDESYSYRLTRRIRLTNQLAFISFLVFTFNALGDFIIINDLLSFVLSLIFSLPCIATLIFNKNEQHKLATSFLLTTLSLAVFYFSSHSGLASGKYLFYFPLLL